MATKISSVISKTVGMPRRIFSVTSRTLYKILLLNK